MDIRNIKEEATVIEQGRELEAIYELQKKLLEGYIGKIEKDLPMYPINVNSRKGQDVLKDFTARIVEEIAEGYESTHHIIQMLDNVGWNFSKLSKPDFQMILNHLQNSNEEQADATAFSVALMLYANVLPEDIYDFCEIKLKDYIEYSKDGWWKRSLDNLMTLGLTLLSEKFDVVISSPSVINRYNLLSEIYLDYSEEEINEMRSYLPGFNFLNSSFQDIESSLAWECSYHLMVSRNFLKNKPWKQTEVMTDESGYQSEIVVGFIMYLGYLKFCGFTAETLYKLFFKKHMVNRFRQKSMY